MRERRERNVQSQYDFAFCEIVLVLGKEFGAGEMQMKFVSYDVGIWQ